MKGSGSFKNTIKAYLDDRAASDPLFAKTYAKEGKSIDECIDYILTTVRDMRVSAMTDEEVYSLAVHYYDEDKPGKIDKGVSCNVIHSGRLTEEEEREMRARAAEEYKEQVKADIEHNLKEQQRKLRDIISGKTKAKEESNEQPTLF